MGTGWDQREAVLLPDTPRRQGQRGFRGRHTQVPEAARGEGRLFSWSCLLVGGKGRPLFWIMQSSCGALREVGGLDQPWRAAAPPTWTQSPPHLGQEGPEPEEGSEQHSGPHPKTAKESWEARGGTSTPSTLPSPHWLAGKGGKAGSGRRQAARARGCLSTPDPEPHPARPGRAL